MISGILRNLNLKFHFFIFSKKKMSERKDIHHRWKYTSWDGISFLNASFKSVESTLLNDAFRKKISSREVYFRPLWNFWWCHLHQKIYHRQNITELTFDFFSECIIRKRRLYAFEWCIQKKNPILGSVFLSMVHFLKIKNVP